MKNDSVSDTSGKIKVRHMPHVEVDKGHMRWFIRIVGSNGEKMLTSQKYFSKTNARRAGKKLAAVFNIAYKEIH